MFLLAKIFAFRVGSPFVSIDSVFGFGFDVNALNLWCLFLSTIYSSIAPPVVTSNILNCQPDLVSIIYIIHSP